MSISASEVKALREITGLGMMDCKQALVEAGGDKEAAIEILRKKAGAKVEKKASRTAADGTISIFKSDKNVSIVEVNSETDFVAKDDKFQGFASAIAQCVANNAPSDFEALMSLPLSQDNDATVAQAREALVSTMGENINIRRFGKFSSDLNTGHYLHQGNKIGVIVEIEGGNETLARDIAMHIAASRPEFVNKNEVPADNLEKEKAFFVSQAQESGKPDDIIEKMVQGRINKYIDEITLVGQPFVKDPDTKVGKLLENENAKVIRFVRYEVGEGIEKKNDDFAAEVMEQVKGSQS